MNRNDALTDAHDHLIVAASRLQSAGIVAAANRVAEEANRARLARLADAFRRGEIVPPAGIVSP